MPYIKVYLDDGAKEFVEVPLYFQFWFYYYLPYVLLEDLINLDPNCVGLLRLNKQNRKISQSRRDERIYLNHEVDMSVETERFILHCLPKRSTNQNTNINMDTVRCDSSSGNDNRDTAVYVSRDSHILSGNNRKEEEVESVNHIRHRNICDEQKKAFFID